MRYKPINVQYGGDRFRSKLEAKWAVFLDYLIVQYQYEPRVYQLDGGIGYLPDFYLPDQDVFLEIKPDKELSEEDARKIYLFSKDLSIRPNLVVCKGEPEQFQDQLFHVRGDQWENVQWAFHPEQNVAKLQMKNGTWGDPWHPAIYGAVEESLNHIYREIPS